MQRLICALFAASIAVLAFSAEAQTTNNGVSICAEAGVQYQQRMAPDGAGGAFVTWQDSRRGNNDIYIQHIGTDGAPLWAPNGVALCSSVGEQATPVIVADGLGGAIVAWQDFRSGSNYDIYAQRVNSSGSTVWTFNGVPLCTIANEQSSPAIATDGSGGAIVTWQDVRTGQYDIYAQRVNAVGSPLWTLDGVSLCNNGNQQQSPVIAEDGSSGAIVVWQDLRSGQWDIYGQRVDAAGAIQWTSNGLAYSAAAGHQDQPRVVADGAGGAIATWQDTRSGTSAIFAQRLNSIGVALWANDGVAICTIAGGATLPVLVRSGSGGAIVTWQDSRNPPAAPDIYAQKVAPGGLPQWSGNGVPVCTVVGSQSAPTISEDTAGGATIAWIDSRFSNSDIYAQRLNSAGVQQWPSEGIAVCSNPNYQYDPIVVSDGGSGAVFSWRDDRYSTAPDVFGQRLNGSGSLLYPDAEYPVLVSIRDIPNDQGGRVKLSWKASNLDLPPFAQVLDYWIWRSVPPNLTNAAMALNQPPPTIEQAALMPQPPRIVMSTQNGATYFWEYLATQPTGHIPNYSFVAATTSDSIAGSNPRTAFMVMARGASQQWYSNPDSGYSVDNLSPSGPQQFTATPAPTTVGLHWSVSHEADLAVYRLYRGTTPGFQPSVSNRISEQPDTGYVDSPAGGLFYYKLSAVDSHGNEGPYVTTSVTSLVGVPSVVLPNSVWLAVPEPNPSIERAVLRFGLPHPGRVELSIVDVAGRLVRVLMHENVGLGEQSAIWDGLDDGGHRVAGGLYFAKLEVDGVRVFRRVVHLE